MAFEEFKKIMVKLGIPERKCKYDPEVGIYRAYSGEIRITGNSSSSAVTVKNLRTGATFMARV